MSVALPRIDHNRKLYDTWKASHSVTHEVAPVISQKPAKLVGGLFPFGYNPSICRWNGRILMAYRYHDSRNSWETSLAIAELNENLETIANNKIELAGQTNEDPRLFVWGSELWIAYVQASLATPGGMPTCVVRHGKLIEGNLWKIEGQFLPTFGKNDNTGMEKNWVPWVRNSHIQFVYTSSPYQKVFSTLNLSSEESVGLRWKWGAIRGGTPPLPLGPGEISLPERCPTISFFHSRLDNEPPMEPPSPAYHHRYYVGAIIRNSESEQTAISRTPILRGSELDSLEAADRKKCYHWKPNVVFPLGAIQHPDGWVLSVGVNDSACALVTLKESDLNL